MGTSGLCRTTPGGAVPQASSLRPSPQSSHPRDWDAGSSASAIPPDACPFRAGADHLGRRRPSPKRRVDLWSCAAAPDLDPEARGSASTCRAPEHSTANAKETRTFEYLTLIGGSKDRVLSLGFAGS